MGGSFPCFSALVSAATFGACAFASSEIVAVVTGGSLRFMGTAGMGGRPDNADEGVAAGVATTEDVIDVV